MVESLQNICRSMVFINTCDKMRSKHKKYFLLNGEPEDIDICKKTSKSMAITKAHKISKSLLLVILNQ